VSITQPEEKTDAASAEALLALAREVLLTEARAVEAVAERLGASFVAAVRTIQAGKGRIVVTGIGKSGHIARKIASTLASTGTPAFFVHSAEAGHGDLGMITSDDVVIALSNSGESPELSAILPVLKRQGARLIALTGNLRSTLAKESDVVLDASVAREAGSLGLAPTASTTAALALGDALALALLEARGFNADDFARAHPGGALGRKLLVRVTDVMHQADALPKVGARATLREALLEMSGKRLGMTAVVNDDGTLAGVFTDGDLRRTLERNIDVRAATVSEVMNRNPHTIGLDKLAAEAVQYMEKYRINGLLVLDGGGRVVGAFNMHDLFRAGVV
jgi:arabinose-5-phosphate isomerase